MYEFDQSLLLYNAGMSEPIPHTDPYAGHGYRIGEEAPDVTPAVDYAEIASRERNINKPAAVSEEKKGLLRSAILFIRSKFNGE